MRQLRTGCQRISFLHRIVTRQRIARFHGIGGNARDAEIKTRDMRRAGKGGVHRCPIAQAEQHAFIFLG
jgi:hypothetical protein